MTTPPELPAGTSGPDPGRHAQNGGQGSAARPDLPVAAGRAAVVLATAFVAVTAFVLAYDGSRGAAVDAGIQAADWYPFCIEGVIVCASVATLALARRAYPWVILLVFSAVSVAANVLHAAQHPGAHLWSLAFAAVPPLALPICVHLLLMVVHPVGQAEPVRGPAVQEATVQPVSHSVVQPVAQPASHGEPADGPVVEPAREPAIGPAWSAGPRAPGPAREPVGGPVREPAAAVDQPPRTAAGEPRRTTRKPAAKRGPAKPADPRSGLRFLCPCCSEMVSRATLDRHAKDAAALASRARSNGHREPAGVS